MKLSAANEAHISNVDARVAVCGGGFPRGYRILNFQIKNRQNDARSTIKHHRNKESPFVCERKPRASEVKRNIRAGDGLKGPLLIYPPSWLRFACHGEAWMVDWRV